MVKAVHIGPNQQEALKSITPKLNSAREDAKLLSANKMYVAEGFDINKSLQSTATDVYQAGLQNGISRITSTLLYNKQMADQLDAQTRLVLVNTLYFTANWVHPFTKELTSQKAILHFRNRNKECRDDAGRIPSELLALRLPEGQILELPFHDSNVTMTFVLPDSKTGLNDVSDKIQD
ncbi:unnamed protein product [Callosobruchus maculatus]|uniref:Serpin domain-containing protein n=1 Tax=Callosobruchus maculatus TaxID=64391 RepID=A0A653D6N1_CALMS|nr:unnamed protein product [Callosobruchus maculatus]